MRLLGEISATFTTILKIKVPKGGLGFPEEPFSKQFL